MENREIKFRAWRTCEMIYQADSGKAHVATLFNRIYEHHKVMQYTGFKDADGKEIYEGDILQMDSKYQYYVTFEDAKFVAKHAQKTNGIVGQTWGPIHRFFDPDLSKYKVQVIGNVYENPELLAGGAV